MADMPHFPFDSSLGHVLQPITPATTNLVITHLVDCLEELAICMLEAGRNSNLGLCNALVFERIGIALHKVLKDIVYLWRAHDILVQLAGRVTTELVTRL